MPLILLYIQYSLNAQHVSAVNTTILRSLQLTSCYFIGGIWFGVCRRSVSVWLWWCGVLMQSQALLSATTSASDCIKTPHRHSHTETERLHTPNQIPPMK